MRISNKGIVLKFYDPPPGWTLSPVVVVYDVRSMRRKTSVSKRAVKRVGFAQVSKVGKIQ